jgi:hypothetical protein
MNKPIHESPIRGLLTLVTRAWMLGYVLTFVAAPAGADENALQEVPVEEKLIYILPARQGAGLEVTMQAEKPRYRVNESIRFRVKGNQRFFLYLFNIDLDDGKGITILPNRYQTERNIR